MMCACCQVKRLQGNGAPDRRNRQIQFNLEVFMGADPEATIYYGFPIDDPEFDYHDANDEWEAARRPAEPTDKSDYRSPAWDKWRTKLREWKSTPELVKVAWSGADECEKYYVHAPALQLTVEWDEQKPLAGVDFNRQVEADNFIEAFCRQLGIEYKQPGWHLAARYF